MKTIEAYQCPICESIHAIQSEAKACEKDCKASAKADEIEKERKAKLQYWRNYVRLNAASIQDVIDMSIEASREICPASALKTVHFNVSYTDKASNSHANPLNGVSNWCGHDKDQPTFYPGLTGSINFEYENYNKKKMDIFDNGWSGILGICTGGGGYNNDGGRYTVTLFLDDFPLIKAKIAEEQENVKKYQDVVSAERVKYVEAVAADLTLKSNNHLIEVIQNQITELNKRASVFQSENRAIHQLHREPSNKVLTEAFGSFSNEFIRVANIGI